MDTIYYKKWIPAGHHRRGRRIHNCTPGGQRINTVSDDDDCVMWIDRSLAVIMQYPISSLSPRKGVWSCVDHEYSSSQREEKRREVTAFVTHLQYQLPIFYSSPSLVLDDEMPFLLRKVIVRGCWLSIQYRMWPIAGSFKAPGWLVVVDGTLTN